MCPLVCESVRVPLGHKSVTGDNGAVSVHNAIPTMALAPSEHRGRVVGIQLAFPHCFFQSPKWNNL